MTTACDHRALNQALTDAQHSEQLAIRGAEKVNREYGLGALAGRLKQLYEQLIEEKACAT